MGQPCLHLCRDYEINLAAILYAQPHYIPPMCLQSSPFQPPANAYRLSFPEANCHVTKAEEERDAMRQFFTRFDMDFHELSANSTEIQSLSDTG